MPTWVIYEPATACLGPVKHAMDLLHGIASKRPYIASGQNSVVEATLVRKSLCEHCLASAWWAVQHEVAEVCLILTSSRCRDRYRLQARLKLGLQNNTIEDRIHCEKKAMNDANSHARLYLWVWPSGAESSSTDAKTDSDVKCRGQAVALGHHQSAAIQEFNNQSQP